MSYGGGSVENLIDATDQRWDTLKQQPDALSHTALVYSENANAWYIHGSLEDHPRVAQTIACKLARS